MIRALALCVLLLMAPAATARTEITLGTRLEGRLANPTTINVLEFQGLAGETLSIKLAALKSTLKPRIELWDTTTGTRIGQADARRKKAVLKQISLPSTGTYEQRVLALDGTSGRWKIKTTSRPAKASAAVDVPADMAGERVRTTFRCSDVGDNAWDSAVLVDNIESLTLAP